MTDPSGVTTTTTFLGSLFDSTTSTTNPTPKDVRYIFLGGSRVASINSSTLLYYHDDHLGGTNVLTDSVGTLKEIIEYEPFGSESRHDKLGNSDEVAWYYFTGKKKDDETGLIYFGARYYDPTVGRFLTPDSLVPRPGNPQEFNRYSYVLNNPINRIDPDGHKSWFKKFWKSIVTIAVGITVGVLTAGIGTAFYTGALGTFWGGIASAATTGAIAGAVSGAVGAGLNGQDILQGTLMGAGYGALGGAVFGGISKFGGKDWNWKVGLERVGLSAVAGGGISELAGGSFADGAMFAGIVAGSDFVYRSIVSTQSQGKNVGASMKTARENGQPKLDVDGKPLTVDNHPDVIHDRSISNVGDPEKAGASGFVHNIAGETGPVMNTLGKYVPGFQGLSLAHDITGYNLTGTGLRGLLNFPTMPVIYGINAAGSLINDSPGMIGFYENYREKK